jgi:hypothetical protein
MQKATAKKLENSLTQNEDHRRRCSLFSIERQFPKLAFGAFSPRKSMKVGQQLTELVALGTSFDPGRRGFDPRVGGEFQFRRIALTS